MSIRLRKLQVADLTFVKEVYDYYTLNTTVVYLMHCVSLDELQTLVPIESFPYQSFVIETLEGEACGFCYYTQFKPKEAFRISVELTLYLKPGCTGKGYGRQALQLMEPLIEEAGFENVVALISGDNEASIRAFERCGYECCANIRQVAEKFGKKLDLKMYQKILPLKKE